LFLFPVLFRGFLLLWRALAASPAVNSSTALGIVTVLLTLCKQRVQPFGVVADPDPGSESGMNIPDHISDSLETIFWVKNT
jgi:hypothetical protein